MPSWVFSVGALVNYHSVFVVAVILGWFVFTLLYSVDELWW